MCAVSEWFNVPRGCTRFVIGRSCMCGKMPHGAICRMAVGQNAALGHPVVRNAMAVRGCKTCFKSLKNELFYAIWHKKSQKL